MSSLPVPAVANLEAPPTPAAGQKVLLLATALAGSFLVAISGQFVSSNLADIQGGVGAFADEGSWITTVYTMGSLAGVVCSIPLVPAFGLGRYMAFSGLLFAVTALGCAVVPAFPVIIVLRAIQGFTAGGFGPMAFVAVFLTLGGPRLPFGLSLLAFILLFPSTIGPALSGILAEHIGWEGLFMLQAIVGAATAIGAIFWTPNRQIDWKSLYRDWAAVAFLSVGLAAMVLVLAQGTRRFWFDSNIITWTVAIWAAASAGFAVTAWQSPLPIINLRLLITRRFLAPISLNLMFRAGFASTAYLVPQFLTLVQGYRPLELAPLFLWAAMAQLLALPVTWWLLQRVDGRYVMALGLLSFGAGALLAAEGTSLAAAAQFRLALSLAAGGQVLFLVPALIAGAGSLKAPEGPTASFAFNATTTGGTTLGIGLATELLTERQKFHSAHLSEAATQYIPPVKQIAEIAAVLANRASDDAIAAGRAAVTVGAALRREALVLAFSDAFLLVGVFLLVSAAGVLFLQSQPPLRKLRTSPQGSLP